MRPLEATGKPSCTLEAAGRPPRTSRSRRETTPRGLQAREHSRKLEKTEVGATWAFWGFTTASSALQQASRRPQERSNRLQHDSKSRPRGIKTPSRVLQEASRRPRERSKSLKTPPAALQDSRRPQELGKSGDRALGDALGRILAFFRGFVRLLVNFWSIFVTKKFATICSASRCWGGGIPRWPSQAEPGRAEPS